MARMRDAPASGAGPDEDAAPEATTEPTELTEQQIAFLNGVFDLARDGAATRVGALLDRGLPVNLTDSKGDTMLILAAYHEHTDLVRVLLEHGADTARLNARGQSALVAAVFRSAAPIVTDLLRVGADPELGSPNARSVAEYFGLTEMAALLASRA